MKTMKTGKPGLSTVSRLAAVTLTIAGLTQTISCQAPFTGPADYAVRLEMETGSEWIHRFPVFGPITKPNHPTYAIWLSDETGTYIDTVFVTAKMGKAGWIMADDARPEALPLWSKSRGGQPDAKSAVPDTVSGATPRGSQSYGITRGTLPSRIYLWLEINHSVDYNEQYRAGIADTANAFYSGGEGGSGQPALVYRTLVDFDAPRGTRFDLELIGCSEPGGAWNGTDFYPARLDSITTARNIIKRASASLR